MSAKRVLVYGGKGGLGSVCVDTFKAQKWVCSFFLTSISTKYQLNGYLFAVGRKY